MKSTNSGGDEGREESGVTQMGRSGFGRSGFMVSRSKPSNCRIEHARTLDRLPETEMDLTTYEKLFNKPIYSLFDL